MEECYLEWLNCSCPDHKVNSINELSDGVIFLHLIGKIGYSCKDGDGNDIKVVSQFIKEKFPDYDFKEDLWLQSTEEIKYISLLFLIYISLKHEDIELRNTFSSNLTVSSQLFIKEFLEEVLESQQHITKNIIINAIKKIDNSQSLLDNITFSDRFTRTSDFTTPARSKRRTSALQDFFQSPNTLKKILDEKNLEQKRLKNELDNELTEKLDLLQRVDDNEKLIQKLEKQLLLRTAENKKLKDEIQQLQYRVNESTFSTNELEIKEVDLEKTRGEVKELERYVSVLENDIESLNKEILSYKNQIHKLSISESSLKDENQIWKQSSLEYGNKCKSLENTLSNLQSEFTLINELYRELRGENERLKIDNLAKKDGLALETELEIQENKRLKEDLSRISADYVKLTDVVKSYVNDKKNDEQLVKYVQDENVRLKNDLSELITNNRCLDRQLDEINVENRSLRRTIDEQAELLNSSRTSENDLRLTIDNLRSNKDELESRCLDYERIIREISDDRDKVNYKYRDLNVEIAELRKTKESLEIDSKNFRSEITMLKTNLDEALEQKRTYERNRDAIITETNERLSRIERVNEQLMSETNRLVTNERKRIIELESKVEQANNSVYLEIVELKKSSEEQLKTTGYLKSKLKHLQDEFSTNLESKLVRFIEIDNERSKNRLNEKVDQIRSLTVCVSEMEKIFHAIADKFERNIEQTASVFDKFSRDYRLRISKCDRDINERYLLDRLNGILLSLQLPVDEIGLKKLYEKFRFFEGELKQKETEVEEMKRKIMTLYDDLQMTVGVGSKRKIRNVWLNNNNNNSNSNNNNNNNTLRQFEIRYNDLRNVIEITRTENTSLRTENTSLRTENTSLRTENTSLRTAVEEQIEKLKDNENKFSRVKEDLEDEINFFRTRINELETRLEQNRAESGIEIARLCAELESSRIETDRLKRNVRDIELEKNLISENATKNEIIIAELRKENDDLNDRIRTDENRLNDLNDRLTKCKTEHHNSNVISLNDRLIQSEREIERSKNSINRLTSENFTLTKELDDKKKTIDSLQSRTIKLERNLADKLERLNRLKTTDRNCQNDKIDRLNRDCSKLSEENERLKETNKILNDDKEKLTSTIESNDKLKSELNRWREKASNAENYKREIETKITEMYSNLQTEIFQLVDKQYDDSTELVVNESQPEIIINRLKDLVVNAMKNDAELTEKKISRLKDRIVEKVRLEYEGKLERAKAELKKVFLQQQQELNDRWTKKENDYKMQIHKQKGHIESLSSQFWDISDKYLRLQQTNAKRESLMSSISNKDQTPADTRNAVQPSTTDMKKSKSVSNLASMEANMREPGLSRFSDFFETAAAKQINGKKQQLPTTGKVFPTADEESEVFDNAALAEITGRNEKRPHNESSENFVDTKRLSVLQERNSLYKPHLRSCYPVETQFVPPSVLKEDEIKMSFNGNIIEDDCIENIPPSETRYRKNRIQTSYKKPGPPTPSKNGGRIPQQAVLCNDTPSRNILRELNIVDGNPTKRKSFTPSRLLNNIFGTRGQVPLSSTVFQNEVRIVTTHLIFMACIITHALLSLLTNK